MIFSNLFVSRHRKLDFSINITIHDLTNVPLVSGLYYIKWKLKNASHTSGLTMSSPIRDHDIFWEHPINTLGHLLITKDNILGSCPFKLQVYQEIGGTNDTILIGTLDINLSEYANTGHTNRRYLLDDCKFNSTVKLSIQIDQLSETDIPYENPPLKKKHSVDDIPNLINNDRKSIQLEERSNGLQMKKSQSFSLMHQYCKQESLFNSTDDPSPTDLVEQLFKQS